MIDSCYPADVPRQQSKEWQHVFQEPEAQALFGPMHEEVWPVPPQVASLETVVDRVLSLSVVSALDQAGKDAVAARVRELLETHPECRGSLLFEIPHCVEMYWFDRLQ